jgi:hypothetical protein
MIVKSGDTLLPILVLPSTPRLFDLCHRLIHPRTRESLLRSLNTRGTVGAINGNFPQHLAQALVGVEVAAVA